MQFNPDYNKQAQKIYFSKKSNNENFHPVTFNNNKSCNLFYTKSYRTFDGPATKFQSGPPEPPGSRGTGPPVLN